MFTLIDLPYAHDGLKPVISARTLEFHHGKHLQGYVDILNKQIAGTPNEGLPLEEIVCKVGGAVFNNVGQIQNHNLYFPQFAPKPAASAPIRDLETQIESQWGYLDAFKADLIAACVGLFDSGWVSL